MYIAFLSSRRRVEISCLIRPSEAKTHQPSATCPVKCWLELCWFIWSHLLGCAQISLCTASDSDLSKASLGWAQIFEMDPWERINFLSQELKCMNQNLEGYRRSLEVASSENQVSGHEQKPFPPPLFFFGLWSALMRSSQSV